MACKFITSLYYTILTLTKSTNCFKTGQLSNKAQYTLMAFTMVFENLRVRAVSLRIHRRQVPTLLHVHLQRSTNVIITQTELHFTANSDVSVVPSSSSTIDAAHAFTKYLRWKKNQYEVDISSGRITIKRNILTNGNNLLQAVISSDLCEGLPDDRCLLRDLNFPCDYLHCFLEQLSAKRRKQAKDIKLPREMTQWMVQPNMTLDLLTSGHSDTVTLGDCSPYLEAVGCGLWDFPRLPCQSAEDGESVVEFPFP